MMENKNSHKQKDFVKLRKSGLSFAEIGRRYGLSRERVRQILNTSRSSRKLEPILNNPDTLLTTRQAAEILNVHLNTIRRWSDQGILETYRIGSRGDRRIKRQTVDAFLLQKLGIHKH
ncbi:excisionase family DNA-binding protein [Chloroflexota bacterium]